MSHRINFSIKSKLIELQQKKSKNENKNKQTNKRKTEEDSEELVMVL